MAKMVSSTEEVDMMNSSSEEFNDYDVESEASGSETDSSTDEPELEDSSCSSAETSSSDTDIADKVEASLSETCVLPQVPIEERVAEDEVRSADAFVGGETAWGPPQNYSPEIPLFTAVPGIKVDTSNFELVDYFYVFVTEAILQDMVCYTNLYAEQYLSSHPLPEYAQAQEWHHTNIHEIKRFLALTIAMGLHTGNTLASYWDTTTVISIPLFSAIMPMNRYQVLLRFLHFNDNTTATPPNEPGHDQLHKLRPLIESLCKRFAEVYTPSQNLCVDQSHMFFKGLRFQQSSPSKRSCNGIKFYKLCESKTRYTSNFMIYEGTDSSLDPPGCPLDFTVGDKIVWELLIPLLGRGYHIYLDDFYTSIPLFRALHSLDTPACGIVSHVRKGLPKTLLNKSLRPGETYGLRSSELLAIKHCDTKTEYMLTTIHDESVIVEQRAGNRPPKSKPLCSKEYNKHIGGVNKTEQIQEYDTTRKTKSWYKKAAFYMIQVALYNSYVVYKAAVPGLKLSFYKYQLQLLPALLFGDVEEVPDVPDNDNVARMVGKHFIDNIPPTLNKKYAQRACKVCRKKGVRRDVRYYCPKCPSKPALCFQPCFELYHTVVHYQNL